MSARGRWSAPSRCRREDAAALAVRLSRVERRLETLGAVNPLAREEYEAAKGRADETAEQIADLEASLRELSRLVRDLTRTIAERFEATFADVERGFVEVVETVFPGGRGRLRLVDAAAPAADPDAEGADDADDEGERLPLEPGVELEISPAGKRIQSLQMLSGGEKALAAIAFLFALMLARPCPFYVLDEVEAALDETNIERFLALVERFRDRAQFVVITHQKRTMEAARRPLWCHHGWRRRLARALPAAAARGCGATGGARAGVSETGARGLFLGLDEPAPAVDGGDDEPRRRRGLFRAPDREPAEEPAGARRADPGHRLRPG